MEIWPEEMSRKLGLCKRAVMWWSHNQWDWKKVVWSKSQWFLAFTLHFSIQLQSMLCIINMAKVSFCFAKKNKKKKLSWISHHAAQEKFQQQATPNRTNIPMMSRKKRSGEWADSSEIHKRPRAATAEVTDNGSLVYSTWKHKQHILYICLQLRRGTFNHHPCEGRTSRWYVRRVERD